MTLPLLSIANLNIHFHRGHSVMHPVRGLSLHVNAGECVAIVGESGCGKSLTALSIARLPPTDHASVSGELILDNTNLSTASPQTLNKLRGSTVAYVFQDTSGALNPVMRVGDQIAECLPHLAKAARHERVVELLTRVGLPAPHRQARAYPCQMSGGMQQRAMLAMALAGSPKLLVADEPTTALDVVTQRLVLDLIATIATADQLAVLLITHNLALAAERARRIYVMYGGQVVETGPSAAIITTPHHPYTHGLLAAVPRLTDPPRHRLRDIPGVVPGADNWPPGCPFAPRCPLATAKCHTTPLPTHHISTTHTCSCWHPLNHEVTPK
ncbi:MAG: ABC transporter ATP-binding protein [Lentisphaerae bacterium]|jgi:oligopeptide/dipeptide ABC transporter ATP-binding protein|nr:ABC transporter ATP-binding protein [Lentisphaerota bacterium]